VPVDPLRADDAVDAHADAFDGSRTLWHLPDVSAAWDSVERRFGSRPSAELIDVFEDPLVSDRFPFYLWSAESWTRLLTVASRETESSEIGRAEMHDLVVIGELTDSPDEYDHERGFMASRGVYYCLDPRSWSGRVVPLFRWKSDESPRRVQADIMRMPQIQDALTNRWLRKARRRE
jgi:hypothetical protein